MGELSEGYEVVGISIHFVTLIGFLIFLWFKAFDFENYLFGFGGQDNIDDDNNKILIFAHPTRRTLHLDNPRVLSEQTNHLCLSAFICGLF